MNKDLIIFSVGGSLIVPNQIDLNFLKAFKKLILDFAKKGKRFVIICGGGKICRDYQKVAKILSKPTQDTEDWLGISSTKLNAHLLWAIFHQWAHPRVVDNPNEKINFREKVLIASGWKPGFSTDYDAALLAKNFQARKLINLTNIDFVYTKDPKKFEDAKPIKEISWKDFRKLVPKKWSPGLNSPFDPVAAQLAQKLNLEVVILNGRKMKNLENYLENKNFVGTKIR